MKKIIFISVFFLFFILIYPNTLDSYNDTINFYVAKSNISGEGIFSKYDRKINDKLFLAISNSFRVTQIGSKINHCWNPNTRLEKISNSGGWWVVANKKIKVGEELTIDYRYTPFFISKPLSTWTC